MAEPATLSNGVYDKLKTATQIWLPATAALYFGLSQIWGLPAGEEVVGTIALLTTFFGVILGISSANYVKSGKDTDGEMVVSTSGEGKRIFSLEVDGDPIDLLDKPRAVFKVTNHDEDFWRNIAE